MECDELEDAMLFLRSALECHAKYGRFARYDIENAIAKIEAYRARATPKERIELLARALCRADNGNENLWANYKRQAEALLSDEYEAVLRKVLQ